MVELGQQDQALGLERGLRPSGAQTLGHCRANRHLSGIVQHHLLSKPRQRLHCVQQGLLVFVVEPTEHGPTDVGTGAARRKSFERGGADAGVVVVEELRTDLLHRRAGILPEHLDTHLPHAIVAVQEQLARKARVVGEQTLERLHRLVVLDIDILLAHRLD